MDRASREPLRLLIVEDEASLRRTLARFFGLRGFEVVEAGSVREAKYHLGRGTYDAALLDVRLPDGCGLDLLPRIGADRSIVITAEPDPERFGREGVCHHMAKPLDLPRIAELVAAVAAM